MLSIETYRKVYSILESTGPVSYDCGQLCNSICCSDSTFEDGDSYIYLFPGEKEYLDSLGSDICIERQKRSEHELPKSWGEYVYIVRCPGKDSCDRSARPIQCRTFPLMPYISNKGELEMITCYMELPYSCPFVKGEVVVSEEFRLATLEAWKILVEEKAIRDLVKLDSKQKNKNFSNQV